MHATTAVAMHGPIAVTSIAGRLSAPHILEFDDVFAEHRRQYAGREISLTLTREGILLPDESARKVIAELSARGESAYQVVVIDSTGFWAAAARGMLASLFLVSSKALVATKSIAEALAHLQPYMKSDPECQDLVALERELVKFRI